MESNLNFNFNLPGNDFNNNNDAVSQNSGPVINNDVNVESDSVSQPKWKVRPGSSNPFLNDDEDEYGRIQNVQATVQPSIEATMSLTGGDPIIRLIEEKFKELKDKYVTGGIHSSRFITTDILLRAPRGYFRKFDVEVEMAVASIQQMISTQGNSDAIADAQNDPVDDALQERAYRVVQAAATEHLNSRALRGMDKSIVMLLAINEIIGFGVLDPLWRDKKVDEILCNGPHDVQVEIKGQLYRVPGAEFRDERHMMALIERLYGSIGKTVSRMTPLVKGRLHDKSRMFAVHSSVAPDGPNFSIRKHPAGYWTASELIKRGTANEEIMTEIGNLIYKGCSFLVIGGTSTGKTSMLNALTGFYRDDVRILTLEDNLEMKPHPNKMLAAAMETQPARADRKDDGGVTMRDLVKGSLQLRPDGIIIGEVTDGAAYDLCQALNTGHFGASTLHANNEEAGIYRVCSLVSESGLVSSEGALPLVSTAFDFVIYLEHYVSDGSRVIASISEIGSEPVRRDDGTMTLKTHPLWKYQPTEMQNGKVMGSWVKVGNISQERRMLRNLDVERDLTWPELYELSKIEDGN